MTNNRKPRIGLTGAPSVSLSMGARDPRARRVAQVALAQRQQLGDGLEIDERARLRVAPAVDPGSLATGADLATTVTYLQSLVAELKAAGMLKDES